MKKLKNYGIILASGNGSRYGANIPKQFIKIAGKTILEHTIGIFEKANNIDEIIIVITPKYRPLAEELLSKNKFKKVAKLINGGETRKESSFIGISSIEDQEANVIIHDCARPLLTQNIISDCIEALKKYNAVDVAIPSSDTIIEINENNVIKSIPNRTNLRREQTPQCFKLSVIKEAHELSKNNSDFTDDCGLIVKYGLGDVYVVEGDVENIKITYPSDIFMANRLFQNRCNLYSEEQNLENLKDKVIVIFESTNGIEEYTAILAKKYGAKVFVASTSSGCDITDYESVVKFLKDVYEKYGKIDYVVNSAGILRMDKITERDIKEIQQDINLNYIGTINIVKASIPYLKETKGQIQLYTSDSHIQGNSSYPTDSSDKKYILNLIQAFAKELEYDEIRINVINYEKVTTSRRFKASGKQPKKVAESSLKTLLSNLTGQVIDVKRD